MLFTTTYATLTIPEPRTLTAVAIFHIIIFPTKSYGDIENSIVCINNILDYEKKGNNVLIYLKNGKNIEIEDSYGFFENQYLKAQRLNMRLERIKNTSL